MRQIFQGIFYHRKELKSDPSNSSKISNSANALTWISRLSRILTFSLNITRLSGKTTKLKMKTSISFWKRSVHSLMRLNDSGEIWQILIGKLMPRKLAAEIVKRSWPNTRKQWRDSLLKTLNLANLGTSWLHES